VPDLPVIVDKDRKDRLRAVLLDYVGGEFPDDKVCVLLSGGADSTVVALAAHHLGKKVTAISYRLDGMPSWDCDTARNTADIMGWEFYEIRVPTSDPKQWFVDLIKKYGCRKKTEVENLYPFLFILDQVQALGFSKVLTGFSNPIPDGRTSSIQCQKDPKKYWSERLDEEFDSTATAKCFDAANDRGILLCQPLNQRSVKEILTGLTTKQVNDPYHKHHWKDLFQSDFNRLGLLKTGITLGLQTGGGIEDFFLPILDDPEINYRGYIDGTDTARLSQLVKLWVKNDANDGGVKPVIRTEFQPYRLEDVYRESAKERFTVVTTFAGGGGSSTGYRLAGGKILLANEMVDEAVATYRANYPDTPVAAMDIRKGISRRGGRDYVLKFFREYGIEEGGYDILDGSPPCSTFSLAGKGEKKNEERDVRYSDITQDRIGMLIHDFVYIANCTKPRVVVIENVPGIQRSPVFKHALDRLRRWGYLVNYKVLCSSHFGVPQRRNRLFVLGVRPDIAKKVGLKSDLDVLSLYPTGSLYEPTIQDAFDGLVIDPRERNMLLTDCRKSSTYELIRAYPKDPAFVTRMVHLKSDWASDFNLVRASWFKPSPTITQMGQQMGRGGVHHPSEDRVFTIAELIRLMGLPDDYRLTGAFNKKAERLGRMVPPLMTAALARSLYKKVIYPTKKA
jgi:DNA-cytosine methyltransferase